MFEFLYAGAGAFSTEQNDTKNNQNNRNKVYKTEYAEKSKDIKCYYPQCCANREDFGQRLVHEFSQKASQRKKATKIKGAYQCVPYISVKNRSYMKILLKKKKSLEINLSKWQYSVKGINGPASPQIS